MSEMIFGFFDSATASVPALDPGLEVHCPVCGDQLSRPMVTTSFMRPGDDKSYFYRMHKECSFNAERITEIESAVIDAPELIRQAGSNN